MRKIQLKDKVIYIGNKAHMKNWKGKINALSSNDDVYVVLWNNGALSTEHSSNLRQEIENDMSSM